MAAKKWSRDEEEKKLKDYMTKVGQQSSDLAKLSKKRQDAIRAEVPAIHRQQENDVLQTAADWSQFYKDDTAWLQEKARLEAKKLLETDEAIDKVEKECVALETELQRLKLVKKDPVVDDSEWAIIYRIRDLMLQHHRLVEVFFNQDFMAELKKSFEKKWSELDERIQGLDESVFDLTHKVSEQVKNFLETDFYPRLSDTVEALRDGHNDALEQLKVSESKLEGCEFRLDRGKDEFTKMQGEHAENLQTVKRLGKALAESQSLRKESEETLNRLKEELAKTTDTIKRREDELARLQGTHADTEETLAQLQLSHETLKQSLEGSQKAKTQLAESLKTIRDDLQTDIDNERTQAAQEKQRLQSKIDALQLKLNDLQTSAKSAQQEYIQDIAKKENAYEAERKNAAREKDEVEAKRKVAVQEKDAVQSELDALRQDLNELSGRSEQLELTHQDDGNTIKDLNASLAAKKTKLQEAKVQATRDSNEIATLKADLDEEKQKATQQQQKMDAQYFSLASLDLTKTAAISSRPVQERTAIVTRAAGFTQTTADLDPARILGSHNSDLPEGTQLIADISPDVFILITAPGKVEIFDKADIQCVEYDTSYRTHLIIDGKSLLVCGITTNVENEKICDSWFDRYAEGVFWKAVEEE